MASNPLSGIYSKMHTDFANFRTQLSALQSALNTRNQNQIASSKSTFSTTLSQVINDLSTVNNGQPASSASPVQSASSGTMTNLQNDLQTLQNALNSIGPSQGNSSQTPLASALSKVQSDIDGLQKAHARHQHSWKNGVYSVNTSGKAINNDNLTALAALFGNGAQNETNGNVNIQA